MNGPDAPIKHRGLCASASPQEAPFNGAWCFIGEVCPSPCRLVFADLLFNFQKEPRRSEVKVQEGANSIVRLLGMKYECKSLIIRNDRESTLNRAAGGLMNSECSACKTRKASVASMKHIFRMSNIPILWEALEQAGSRSLADHRDPCRP